MLRSDEECLSRPRPLKLNDRLLLNTYCRRNAADWRSSYWYFLIVLLPVARGTTGAGISSWRAYNRNTYSCG